MDILQFLFWLGALCLFFPAGWIIGRLQDVNWRCKKMRQILKKDYRLLKYKFKGSKTLFARIVDVTSGVITVGSQQWIISESRMYLEANQKVGLSIKKLDKDPAYDDGCPVIYVDSDNITPLEFSGDNTNVRPEELGSTYSGYLLNQLMKSLSFVKNIKLLLSLAVILCALSIILSYLNHVDAATIMEKQDQLQKQIDSLSSSLKPQTQGSVPAMKVPVVAPNG